MEKIVPENNEQLKQAIALELEDARFAGGFNVPFLMLALAIAFGLEGLNISPVSRLTLLTIAGAASAIVIRFRIRCLANARFYISKLKT